MPVLAILSNLIYVHSDIEAPSAIPGNFHAQMRISTSITLAWIAVDANDFNGDMEAYNVTCRLNGTIIFTANVTGTSVTITGLTYPTTYSVQVAAISTGGTGVFTAPLDVATTQDDPPSPTANFTQTTTSITATLGTVSGNFKVDQYCCNFTRTHVSSVPKVLPTVIRCNDAGNISLDEIEEDATYLVTAFVTNTASRTGPGSAVQTIRTLPTPPTIAPLTKVTPGITSIQLSWNLPIQTLQLNGVLLGYNIICKLSNGTLVTSFNTTSTTATISTTTTTHTTTIKPLNYETNYTVQVAAISSGGIGVYSTSKSVITKQEFAPRPTVTEGNLDRKVTMFLSAKPGNYNFLDFCCYFERLSVSNIVGTSLPLVMICSKYSPVVLSPADEDSLYWGYCVVRSTAVSHSGTNVDGHPIRFSTRTTSAAPSSAPGDLEQTSRSSTSISLQWTAVYGTELNGAFVGYNVTCTLDRDIVYTVNHIMTNINIAGLAFGTTYSVQVAAISTGGLGVFTSPIVVQTAQDLPMKPNISLSSTATSLTATLSAESRHTRVSKYCAIFIRTVVSGVLLPLPPVTACHDADYVTLDGIEEDALYTVEALMNNTAGEYGPKSETLQFSTQIAAPTAAPAELLHVQYNQTAVRLMWTPVDNIHLNGRFLAYNIRCKLHGEIVIERNETRTRSTIANLSSGVTYDIQVAAISTGGLGSYSEAANVTIRHEENMNAQTSTSSTLVAPTLMVGVGSAFALVSVILVTIVIVLVKRRKRTVSATLASSFDLGILATKEGNKTAEKESCVDCDDPPYVVHGQMESACTQEEHLTDPVVMMTNSSVYDAIRTGGRPSVRFDPGQQGSADAYFREDNEYVMMQSQVQNNPGGKAGGDVDNDNHDQDGDDKEYVMMQSFVPTTEPTVHPDEPVYDLVLA